MMEEGQKNKITLGDPQLVNKIVEEYMSQGHFDQLRKMRMTELDSMSSYDSSRRRIESTVQSFLVKQSWRPTLVKNQLRDALKRKIMNAPYLRPDVRRIVEQLVDRSNMTELRPQLEAIAKSLLGVNDEPQPDVEVTQESMEITQDTLNAVDSDEESQMVVVTEENSVPDSMGEETESTVENNLVNAMEELILPESTTLSEEVADEPMDAAVMPQEESETNAFDINGESVEDDDSDHSIINQMSPISAGTPTPPPSPSPLVQSVLTTTKRASEFVGKIPKLNKNSAKTGDEGLAVLKPESPAAKNEEEKNSDRKNERSSDKNSSKSKDGTSGSSRDRERRVDRDKSKHRDKSRDRDRDKDRSSTRDKERDHSDSKENSRRDDRDRERTRDGSNRNDKNQIHSSRDRDRKSSSQRHRHDDEKSQRSRDSTTRDRREGGKERDKERKDDRNRDRKDDQRDRDRKEDRHRKENDRSKTRKDNDRDRGRSDNGKSQERRERERSRDKKTRHDGASRRDRSRDSKDREEVAGEKEHVGKDEKSPNGVVEDPGPKPPMQKETHNKEVANIPEPEEEPCSIKSEKNEVESAAVSTNNMEPSEVKPRLRKLSIDSNSKEGSGPCSDVDMIVDQSTKKTEAMDANDEISSESLKTVDEVSRDSQDSESSKERERLPPKYKIATLSPILTRSKGRKPVVEKATDSNKHKRSSKRVMKKISFD